MRAPAIARLAAYGFPADVITEPKANVATPVAARRSSAVAFCRPWPDVYQRTDVSIKRPDCKCRRVGGEVSHAAGVWLRPWARRSWRLTSMAFVSSSLKPPPRSADRHRAAARRVVPGDGGAELIQLRPS